MKKQKYSALFITELEKNFNLLISTLNKIAVKQYNSRALKKTILDSIYIEISSLEPKFNGDKENLFHDCSNILTDNNFESKGLDFLEDRFSIEIKQKYDQFLHWKVIDMSYIQFIIDLARYMSHKLFRLNLKAQSVQHYLENKIIEDYVKLNKRGDIPKLKFNQIVHEQKKKTPTPSKKSKLELGKEKTHILISLLVDYITKSLEQDPPKKCSSVDIMKVVSIISNEFEEDFDLAKIKSDHSGVKNINKGFVKYFAGKKDTKDKFIRTLKNEFPNNPNQYYSFRDYIDNYLK